MTRYYVHIPARIETVEVMGDIVVRCSLPFVGTQLLWAPLRGYFREHGYVIEPEIEGQPHYIKYKGVTYEFEWRGHHHARITMITDEETKDIRYSELPEAVRKLL